MISTMHGIYRKKWRIQNPRQSRSKIEKVTEILLNIQRQWLRLPEKQEAELCISLYIWAGDSRKELMGIYLKVQMFTWLPNQVEVHINGNQVEVTGNQVEVHLTGSQAIVQVTGNHVTVQMTCSYCRCKRFYLTASDLSTTALATFVIFCLFAFSLFIMWMLSFESNFVCIFIMALLYVYIAMMVIVFCNFLVWSSLTVMYFYICTFFPCGDSQNVRMREFFELVFHIWHTVKLY